MQRRWLGLGTRLAGEFGVIFLGVALALAADDWREGRAERAEARESLAVILTDLRRDSAVVRAYGELLRPRIEGAGRLLEDWDRTGQHPDTVDGRMAMALSGPRGPALRRAGFDGLIGSNGLRLIEDASLRARLLDYYQREQPSFVEFAEAAEDLRLQARRDLAPYAEWPVEGIRETSRNGAARRLVRLVTPWPRIAEDDALRHDLAWSYRMRAALLDTQLPDILQRIDELIGLVEEAVGPP